MYFASRVSAGEKLAEELTQLRFENTVLVALTDGAVAVAQPIAELLHSTVWRLISRPVNLPSATTETIGSIGQDGSFVFGDEYSETETEELTSEFHEYIEEEKLRQLHDINQLIGELGVVGPEVLRGRIVIVVSDGLAGISTLDSLRAFLKPLRIERLVAAVPVASVKAVDKMHILFDEIHCLSVVDNYISTDHYYNDEPAMDHETAMATVQQIIKQWR